MAAVTAVATLPYLCRAFPGEPRIILPQHRGVAGWKIPSSDTKLKGKHLPPTWPTLYAPVSPNLSLSRKEKKSLGQSEPFFLMVQEILKGPGRSFNWAVRGRHRH